MTNPWAQAHDLAQLGELTAQWIEGAIAAHPAGPLDPETEPLIPVLAQLNRAGLVTDFSQPGELDTNHEGKPWIQRAAVTGFCDDGTRARLERHIGPTELVMLAEPHGDLQHARIPVTISDGEPHTWVGGSYDDDYLLTCYAQPPHAVHPDGLLALRSAWYVTVFDPVWGRNDRLWPALTAALTT